MQLSNTSRTSRCVLNSRSKLLTRIMICLSAKNSVKKIMPGSKPKLKTIFHQVTSGGATTINSDTWQK